MVEDPDLGIATVDFRLNQLPDHGYIEVHDRGALLSTSDTFS